MISFDDYKKLDLKIAEIVEVKDHPNADKLYLVTVRIGDKEKQLIAGLKGHYSPEELKGKQVVVLDNLEPAVIRGIKSEGMLLAAGDDEQIAILVPEKPVKTGSGVK
jgi:methionyl-tRNA synthetase